MKVYFLFVFAFLSTCSIVEGNMLLDLNEEISPIYNDNNGFTFLESFDEPKQQKFEIDRFSQPIANEMRHLMDPRWKQIAQSLIPEKPLRSRIIRDFKKIMTFDKFASKMMKNVQDKQWRKNKAKIEIVDSVKSNMANWQLGM